MKNYTDISEYFESYLDGDLTKDESLVFEERLKSDEAFKEAFDLHMALDAIIIGKETTELNAEVRDLFKSKKQKIKRTKGYVALGVLACLIGASLFIEFDTEDSKPEVVATQIAREKAAVPNEVKPSVERIEEKEVAEPVSKSIQVIEEKESAGELKIVDQPKVDTLLIVEEKEEDKTQKEIKIQPNENVTRVTQKEEVLPCEGINIVFELETEPSCDYETTGSIKAEISGGQEPYRLYVDERAYGAKSEVTRLEGGFHVVYVLDANWCKSDVIDDVYIETVTCKQFDKAFNPNFGTWDVIYDDEVRLVIRDVSGVVVFDRLGTAFYWSGKDKNGDDLPANQYLYEISKEHEVIKRGKVSIFR